jgi:hypothetical protein
MYTANLRVLDVFWCIIYYSKCLAKSGTETLRIFVADKLEAAIVKIWQRLENGQDKLQYSICGRKDWIEIARTIIAGRQ